jgi:pyruvate dehydrogenase E1 component alpha subunit
MEGTDLDKVDGVEIFRRMRLIRCVEETIAARYHEQKMRCPVHLSTGQEAVAAAVGYALRKDDFAVSGHRAHAHYMGKGGDVSAMIAEIYGKRTGCSAGKGGSMHLIDESVGFKGSTAIVGGTVPVGVGLGLSIQLQKTDQVSCVFLGDGAVEEGVFFEAVNFAVLRRLPVLFVCENNFYSVYSHLRVRQPEGRKIHKMAEGLGLRAAWGDGNDAVAVYQTVASAIRRMRAGSGPEFLEFTTYRWREHCGPNFDNNIGYREETEYLEWKAKDPVERMEKVALNAHWLTADHIRQMDGVIEKMVADAFAFAEQSPFPDPKEIHTHLFKEATT